MLLNLLPHRELRRRRQRQAFRRAIAAAAGLGLFMAALGYALQQQRLAGQQRRNELLSAEVARLDAQLREVRQVQAGMAALQRREQALQALQLERRRPAQLFEALAQHLPAGVQLTALRQAGDVVALQGVALGSAEVATLLQRLAQAAPVLQQPALVELQATAPMPGREPGGRFDFTLELRLQRAQADAPAGPAASAPASHPPAVPVS
ncbi:PilN domain-containing protein [Azohydromonas caseinilytica]|uniref:Fimbrial assembly protein n=1 Tax=Azohydromonas caseinilytica TaxID=2728836 RepID=A0A848F418_9BURK|nr:PilN domain-containing protein [Azohydromonas caseinilytica]NML13455.1 fimbrial assembly protein [Azohydromonas caseinilytica]